jgi:hypothetical protein
LACERVLDNQRERGSPEGVTGLVARTSGQGGGQRLTRCIHALVLDMRMMGCLCGAA